MRTNLAAVHLTWGIEGEAQQPRLYVHMFRLDQDGRGIVPSCHHSLLFLVTGDRCVQSVPPHSVSLSMRDGRATASGGQATTTRTRGSRIAHKAVTYLGAVTDTWERLVDVDCRSLSGLKCRCIRETHSASPSSMTRPQPEAQSHVRVTEPQLGVKLPGYVVACRMTTDLRRVPAAWALICVVPGAFRVLLHPKRDVGLLWRRQASGSRRPAAMARCRSTCVTSDLGQGGWRS